MENSTDIILEGNTATWVMPRMESETGGTYTGTFTFKCYLDPLTQLQAGREFTELLGSLANQASEAEFTLSFALTQLKHRIISAPPFWTSTLQDGGGYGGNIGDLNIISAVLEASTRASNLFKQKIQDEREALLNRAIKAGEKIIEKNTPKEEVPS